MKKITGKTACNGTAVGPIAVMRNTEIKISNQLAGNSDAEIMRVKDAIETAKSQLESLYEQQMDEGSSDSAEILNVHIMLLQDEEFQNGIFNLIEENSYSAEYAVVQNCNALEAIFKSMDDEYMRERSADISDISMRVLRSLKGIDREFQLNVPSIVVADDLSPSETLMMDKSAILAFVTVKGSSNSHTAILARMMGIPALVKTQINLEELEDGTEAIVYGDDGIFVLEPEKQELDDAHEKIRAEAEDKAVLESFRGKHIISPSGRPLKLMANIGSPDDAELALNNDAEGVGLFRSEFLYLGRTESPSEEEQFEVYKTVLSKMGDREVIIRTLDIGADKKVDYLGLANEDNPALGMRAIRICLSQPEIFRVQLRALIRASAYGKLGIMYPMITSCSEVQEILEIVEYVKAELESEGIPYGDFQQGIMIETPAAALISDELAKLVDFFSVGTNDLTQYTLALDRQSNILDRFNNPHHPAVLKLIRLAADSIHAEGGWIGICGELGSDTSLSETFMNMGIDELSMAPSMILKVKKHIFDLCKLLYR